MSLTAQAETPSAIQMKLLVVSADGTEPSFAAIQAFLQQIGVPFDTMIASQTTLTAQTLSTGTGTGHYQGILLATGNLGYLNSTTNTYVSAFTDAEWQTLWQYEATFRVRQVTLYTYPAGYPDNYGLNVVSSADTSATPLATNLTSSGKQVFNYLNGQSPVTIQNAWTYLATPATSTNPVPLLTTSNGYAIASVYTYTNGRQNLTITADENPYLIHSLELGYGIVNWVSKGMFLGSRHTFLSPQIDDILIDDAIWDTNALTDNTGLTFRMSGTDFSNFSNWQSKFYQSTPNASQFRVQWAFNGYGATAGAYSPDTLTPAIKRGQGAFRWTSHTFDHANLDQISYADATSELQQNAQMAQKLGLQQFTKDNMVQPDVSGLNNPNFLQAAEDFGIRYLITDTSISGVPNNGTNPSPNAGIYDSYMPNILAIPRRPTNLYYNVATPAEWVSEYNYFYAPGGIVPTWSSPQTYAQVLDHESQQMLLDMLAYSADPFMFHQPNAFAYDGTHTLFGDLMAATMNKYNTLFALPIHSLAEHDIGVLMANRMAYNSSGVTGTLNLGALLNSITLKTVNAAPVPLTGVSYGLSQESYGGQTISTITLPANGSTTVPAGTW